MTRYYRRYLQLWWLLWKGDVQGIYERTVSDG